jgi:uncharacterized protein
MSSQLPVLANPWRLVQLGRCFAGSAKAAEFPRLREAVEQIVGDIDYQLDFRRNTAGQAQIRGRMTVNLQLTCRRCLEPMDVRVDSPFALLMVLTDAEADAMAEEQDAVVLADDPVRLFDLLEDEALISLPAYPCHAQAVCQLPSSATADISAGDDAAGAVEDNPFAVLAGLAKH